MPTDSPGVGGETGSRDANGYYSRRHNLIFKSMNGKNVYVGREVSLDEGVVPCCERINVASRYSADDLFASNDNFPIIITILVEAALVNREAVWSENQSYAETCDVGLTVNSLFSRADVRCRYRRAKKG